jgi:hypothetical protein
MGENLSKGEVRGPTLILCIRESDYKRTSWERARERHHKSLTIQDGVLGASPLYLDHR